MHGVGAHAHGVSERMAHKAEPPAGRLPRHGSPPRMPCPPRTQAMQQAGAGGPGAAGAGGMPPPQLGMAVTSPSNGPKCSACPRTLNQLERSVAHASGGKCVSCIAAGIPGGSACRVCSRGWGPADAAPVQCAQCALLMHASCAATSAGSPSLAGGPRGGLRLCPSCQGALAQVRRACGPASPIRDHIIADLDGRSRITELRVALTEPLACGSLACAHTGARAFARARTHHDPCLTTRRALTPLHPRRPHAGPPAVARDAGRLRGAAEADEARARHAARHVLHLPGRHDQVRGGCYAWAHRSDATGLAVC